MVDPAVRRRSVGDDGSDPRGGHSDRRRPDDDPPVTEEVTEEYVEYVEEDVVEEVVEESVPAEESGGRTGSLYDAALPDGPAEETLGALGRPFSRQGAFYRGFVTALGVLAAIALAFAVRDAGSVLEMLLIAAFLAVGLNPIVEFAIRRGMSRGWAVLLVALVVLGILAAVVIVVGGALRTQVQNFINDLPQLIKDLRKHKSIAHLDAKYHFLSTLQKKIENPEFLKDNGGVFNVGLSVLNGVAETVIVFILMLYFLATLPTLKVALYSLAPASRRSRVGALGDEILRRVGRYVIGAVLVALCAGTVTLLFLISVGLAQYALPFALLVALLDLVPLVGSIVGASTVCIVCLANSLPIGISAIVFYVIYEVLEGYVIYPRVMRSSVDVPEYVTIIAVLLGGAIGGIVGALLALPLGAALLLLVREVWVRRQDVS